MVTRTNVKNVKGDSIEMDASSTQGITSETPAPVKLPWEPMELVAIGTVAALLEASSGSQSDGNTGAGQKMMVGL